MGQLESGHAQAEDAVNTPGSDSESVTQGSVCWLTMIVQVQPHKCGEDKSARQYPSYSTPRTDIPSCLTISFPKASGAQEALGTIGTS